jgi:hypothetical protein
MAARGRPWPLVQRRLPHLHQPDCPPSRDGTARGTGSGRRPRAAGVAMDGRSQHGEDGVSVCAGMPRSPGHGRLMGRASCKVVRGDVDKSSVCCLCAAVLLLGTFLAALALPCWCWPCWCGVPKTATALPLAACRLLLSAWPSAALRCEGPLLGWLVCSAQSPQPQPSLISDQRGPFHCGSDSLLRDPRMHLPARHLTIAPRNARVCIQQHAPHIQHAHARLRPRPRPRPQRPPPPPPPPTHCQVSPRRPPTDPSSIQ